MAWFLIKNFEGGGESIGDIVEVRDDSQSMGSRLERDPNRFTIVSVPGLDPDTVRHFMDAHVDDADPEKPIVLNRRRYSVDDLLASLGPYHVEDNIYEVPQVNMGLINGKLRDKGA